jgi:NAD kinase
VGTLLKAEREYPGIPKALLRDSNIGKLYSDHKAHELIDALKTGAYTVEERLTLQAFAHGKQYRAANDVIIRNKLLTQATRFTIDAGQGQLEGEFIGDGLVIATPLGSTAYYHTITRDSFASGIGIAFNNVIQLPRFAPHFSEDVQLKITITRGPAELGVDNSVHTEELKDGDVVRVRKCDLPLRIIRLNKPT